jgi:hypothetical protein
MLREWMLEKMVNMLRQLKELLADPSDFFDNVKTENWKPAFIFFLWVTLIISIVTPLVNSLGIESTDISSSYQAQIAAYNIVKNDLLQTYGSASFLLEPILIFTFAVPILLFLTVLLHAIYRIIGGQGSVLNAWKAACYGIGPCLLGGFLPYIALFAAFYSFAMQFYIGPRELYQAKESRAIAVFVAMIALTFIEMFVLGTTVGF